MGLGETPEEKAFLAMTLAGVPAAGRDLPPSALPTIPQEVRSVGRFGFVRTPETYVLDEVLEREHVNNVLRLTEPRLAGRGAKPTEVAGGTGLFGGEASPNALYRFDEAVDDDAIRQTAAIRGLAYGQDQQLWYRRSVDTDLPENKTKSIVVTGPAGAPLSEQAIADVISRVRQDDVLGTYGGATRDGDHLMFLNLKRYTGMDDDEFQRRVMQGLADVGQQHDIKPFNSTFYAEHLDGTPAYLRTLGRYPDALRAARDAIVDAAPEYRRYAERIGADVAEVDARVAERLDGLDRLLRQVESPPPLGRTQGAIPLKDAAQTVYTRFPRILGTKPERVVPEMVSRLDTMVNDLVDQGVIPREMAQDWYRGATLDQRAIARLALPELREDPKYTLYTVVNSILSSGQEVPVETRQGLNVFNQYLRTGRFSVLDPESVQYKQALTGGKKGLTGERGEGVLGERMAASPRTLNHEQALARLDAMVQSLGEEGTIEALVGGVPILGPGRVVKEERPALVYLFGPKIGQYAMDKLGMPGGGKSTIDLWMARLDYALRGDKAGAAGGKMQDAVSPEMRRRMQQVLAEFATRNNMPESSAQALAWYAIKNAFRNAGAKEKRLAYTTLGSGTTEALMSPAKDFSTPIAQGLMRGQSYARAAEGWDDKTLREFARRTGREGAIQPIAGAFAGKVFDIGGATGEVFRRLASTEAGRRALVKTGVIGAGELVETAGEGEDGSPFLRATGKGMKALGAASLVYPTMKRGAVAGGTRVRDALAQSPQGRFILNSISRDILADPRVKELVEAAVDEQARYNAISRQLSAEAQRLGPEGNRLVSDVVEQEAFENAQMSPDDMAAVIALANRIADAVEGMGAEKVGQRLISPATYEKGRRTYLRRDYARYAGEAAMEETPAGARKAPFRLETMKQRLDLTPEQRNELGEIREASYKVAQTIGRGGKDIATARLFNALADLPGMVEPRYKAALDEMLIAKGLRDAARETGDDVAAKDAARAYLEAKGRLKQVSDEFKKNPSEYVTMPDTPNLGVLRGAVVRRDVADYVNGVDDFGDTTSIFKQLNQIWKKVKTVYNASTHFGNFMSNIGVAHVKGLPIQLQPYYLKLAADALDPNIKFAVGRTIAGGAVGGMLGDTPAERAQYALAGAAAAGAGPEVLRRTGVLKSQKRPIKYDPDVQFLTESGILGSSLPFYGNLPMQGLTEDRTALRALAGTTRPETRTVLAEQGIKPMGRAEQVAREADTRITRAYALEDGIFRVALFKRFKDQGLDNAQALAKLKESFPSYDTRSPILKVTRNFYSPFVMFSAKYIPMMLDGIMQHPERWVTLAAIWGGVNELSRRQYGEVRPEDLPANQRDYNYLIPGRIQVDAITRPAFKALGIDVPEGDKYTFDVARWTPFSAITGSPAPGMIASQLDIGGLPIPAIAQPGGPIVDVAALAFGVDPFTGEKILQPGMSGTEQLEAIAGQAASIATPSMLSFQIPRILKDLERGDDAAAAVDALSLVGLRPQVVRRGLQGIREKKKYEDAVRGIRMRYKVEMRKNRDPERRKELQEEAMRGLLREAQKYKAIMQPEMP
jgi:hypothetical protein